MQSEKIIFNFILCLLWHKLLSQQREKHLWSITYEICFVHFYLVLYSLFLVIVEHCGLHWWSFSMCSINKHWFDWLIDWRQPAALSLFSSCLQAYSTVFDFFVTVGSFPRSQMQALIIEPNNTVARSMWPAQNNLTVTAPDKRRFCVCSHSLYCSVKINRWKSNKTLRLGGDSDAFISSLMYYCNSSVRMDSKRDFCQKIQCKKM